MEVPVPQVSLAQRRSMRFSTGLRGAPPCTPMILFSRRRGAYDQAAMSDLPAIISPRQIEPADTTEDLAFAVPAESQELATAPWSQWAAPLGPFVAEATAEALLASLASWSRRHRAPSTLQHVSFVLVEAAVEVARSPGTPPTEKIEALRLGVRVVEVLAASEEAQEQRRDTRPRGLTPRVLHTTALLGVAWFGAKALSEHRHQ